MSAAPQVISDPINVNARLRELRLTAGLLENAIVAGQVSRADCTANDPPSFAGVTGWAVTTRSLREQLMPLGWIKSDAGNFSTIRSPDQSLAIVVSTGDDATGLPHRTPKTKFPKGPATAAAVERNQYDLFIESVTMPVVQARDVAQTPVTWVLLIARRAGTVSAELSLPDGVGEDGRIESWNERLILTNLPGDDGFELPIPNPGPDFDIDIVRLIG